ncbi:MAG: TonB family protein [Bacteroidales bacterium]|nr:TonB family protein [Bacteroidales bacterium]
MKSTALILTLIFTAGIACSQTDTTIFRFVDEMPIFKDSIGLEAFHSYLNQNVDLSDIQENLISGKLIVQFCIDSNGYTTDIKIIKSLRDDFDNAVVNTIKNSPQWIPGKKNGIPVKMLYIMPMDFDFQ